MRRFAFRARFSARGDERACSAAPLHVPAPAAAQDTYPTRPVRLVVGFGAGGPTDIPARFIADKLGTLLGQRVIVENKTGAAGMLATRDVLAQPADGYNLLLCTHFESINTVLYKNPGFKLRDLAPISLIAKYYYGLALSNSIPAKTIRSSSWRTPRRGRRSQLRARSARARRRRSWRGSSRSLPASR